MASKSSAIELHLHFARKLQELEASHYGKLSPEKMFLQQIIKAERLLSFLTNDLRHDYEKQVASLQKNKIHIHIRVKK